MTARDAAKDVARQAESGMVLFRVSSKSNPTAVAGALVATMEDLVKLSVLPVVKIRVIGAGALNQAVKAVAIACRLRAANDQEFWLRPAFEDVILEGQERSAITLRVKLVSG